MRKELSVIRLCVIGCLSLAIVGSIGCGPKKPEMYKVTGTVKYADGTVPQGEVRIIRFEPESFASGRAEIGTKTAQADIQPDGTFQLSTVDPNDGAFPGNYKVTFTIRGSYTGGESGVHPKYTTAATTPHSATVGKGQKNHFDFVIEKP